MRKFITGVVALLLAVVCQAAPKTLRDPGDAWPWGAELPFPWKGIQGTWMAKVDGYINYFKFVTIRSENGFNQLQVTQYDANCETIANGAGYEQERVVKAMMTGIYGTFNLTVHVFRQSDLRESKAPGYVQVPRARTVTVLNLIPLGTGLATKNTFQLERVDQDPAYGACDVSP